MTKVTMMSLLWLWHHWSIYPHGARFTKNLIIFCPFCQLI